MDDFGAQLANIQRIAEEATEIARLRAIEKAARALVDNVKRRHPGEPLTCPFMIQLDAACGRSAQ